MMSKGILVRFVGLMLVLGAVQLQAADQKGVDVLAESVVVASWVDINSAGAEELAAKLKGVGVKKAEAIVALREQNGPFTDASQLMAVKGIGSAILAKNKSLIRLE